MIAFVKGNVFSIEENAVVLDTGSVGIRVYMSPGSLAKLKLGESVTIFTYLKVAEDIFDLYGFLTEDEFLMFKKIISVSGAGPKAGLAILSVLSPSEFALAVATDNYKAITKAQGVGPKLAQKIVLELKDKIKNSDLVGFSDDSIVNVGGAASDDALDALVVLGYTKGEAASALSKIDKTLSTEEKIRQALLVLAR